jgi:transposase-like protein
MIDLAAQLVTLAHPDDDEHRPSLAELAAIANREGELAVRAMRDTLNHAIACGEALLAAKAQISDGGWTEWLAANFQGSSTTAHRFMRVATYRDQIPQGVDGLMKADELLRGLPRANGRVWGTNPHIVAEAVRLYRAGDITLAEIAERYKVALSTAHRWVHREIRAEYDKAAAQTLLQQRREHAARRHGGSVYKSYSLIRKTAQEIGRAVDETSNQELRKALQSALVSIYEAEDAVVFGMGVVA